MPAADSPTAAYGLALRLLTRREYSAGELTERLMRKGFASATIEHTLAELAAAGLQDDTRFAQLFAEQRFERGDGPLKIRAALETRAIDKAMVDSALAPFEERWLDRARRALEKRFGSAAPADARERARRLRFLQGRGFPQQTALRATDRPEDGENQRDD